MNVNQAKKRIAKIREVTNDYERAHVLEDELHREVLLAIARGETEDPAKLAKVALRSRTLRFPRVCA